MKSKIMTPESHLSHVSARVSRLYERFRLMPFQFFGEKEIHYEFYKELNNLRKNGQRYREMKIIREFPTSSLFKKGRDGKLKKSARGKRAYIDLVIEHPSGNIGFEFCFRKQTPYIEKKYNQDIFILRDRTVSPKEVLIHTHNDFLKLKDKTDLLFSWIILFIATYHERESSRSRFIEKKRNKIIQDLEEMKDDIPNNIRIMYLEKSYVGDLNNKGEWYPWQSG